MPSLTTLNTLALGTLLASAAVAVWGTWGIAFRTGFLALIKSMRVLPVVNVPLHETYTGISPIDKFIQRLHLILYPAVDGTWPGLCLVAWEFSGSFAVTWMVVGLEGLRMGNKEKVLAFTATVSQLSQIVTYCIVMPLYLFLHLLTSPTNTASPSLLTGTVTADNNVATAFLAADPADLAAWAPAFALSYLLPSFLVIFPAPRFMSWTVKQYIMASWDLYAVPFKIFQILLAKYVFRKIYTSASGQRGVPVKTSTSGEPDKESLAEKKAETLGILRKTYLFAFLTAAVTHVISLTLSLSSVFFPAVFSSSLSSAVESKVYGGHSPYAFAPGNIFLPVSPFYTAQVKSPGEGLHHFLVWNMAVSNFAPVVWAGLQLWGAVVRMKERRVGEEHGKDGGKVKGKAVARGWNWEWLVEMIGAGVLGGPAGVAVWCLWRRDELVLG
ncbi:hypothetical protein XPA_006919 [Xanthoria parietina]